MYLSRAVDVQPCFNRDVISDLSDQATTSRQELDAWAEGEKIQYILTDGDQDVNMRQMPQEDVDLDLQLLQAVAAGNVSVVQDWIGRIRSLPDGSQRVTKAFFSTADKAPDETLKLLLETNLVDLASVDEINQRNVIHKAAISGRIILLHAGLAHGVNVRAQDVYGRIPIHYACIHGHVSLIRELREAGPDTIDFKDHDNFTPLIHSIVHSHLFCVQVLLEHQARINPMTEAEHIPLNLACQHGSVPVVELLLRRQPKILPDAEGLYPQHLVARSSKNPQLLLLLRDYGADLDQPDKMYQWTPLFHAASEGNVDCLKCLLRCNVDVRCEDEKGLSALYYATWEGHLECMRLLAEAQSSPPSSTTPQAMPPPPQLTAPMPLPSSTPGPVAKDAESIPDFYLPPPIIPVRRYGHNFLEHKTFVMIRLGDKDGNAITFYDDSKYPAARITVSSKSSDLIPRNILLPVQEDSKTIAFQIDNLDTFSIDFDIYPTFGAKVIARAVVDSPIFNNANRSSDATNLVLLDPRLRAIGRIYFTFLVIRPFQGVPLEVTHFSTYWKATRQNDSHPGALVAGSSLSGDYVRLFVQLTNDGIPVLYPEWEIQLEYQEEGIPVMSRKYNDFALLGAKALGGRSALEALKETPSSNLHQIFEICRQSFASLKDILSTLPAHVHVELHILYSTHTKNTDSAFADINKFSDAILRVVFDHARKMRESSEGFQRSIVFSSFSPDVCSALNWKQPNCELHRLPCNLYVSSSQLIIKQTPFSSATNSGPKGQAHKPER